MQSHRIWHTLWICVLAFLPNTPAAIHYVDVSNATPVAPYTNWASASTNIQMAIVWSDNGDEILVAPGRYRLYGSALELPNDKTLTLRSTQSRAAVIDAQRLSYAMWIRGSNDVVEGFTIRNGLSDGSPGGVYIVAPSTLKDCLVTSNQAWGAGGVEIYVNGAVVENCTIQSNLATYYGGGVVFYAGSTSRVQNCIISDNIASNYGAGVSFQNGGSVSNCYISGNRSEIMYGGGMYMDQGGELVNSVVVNNYAGLDGGGIYAGGTGARATPIVNCTVVSNTAGRESGGIYAAYYCRLVNDISYFNTAPTNENLYNHNLLSIVSNCCLTPDYGWPNITNAPAFVNSGAGDFRLATASFCIDTGTTNGAPATDIVGNPRPRRGVPGSGSTNCDMGAYEYGFHFNAIQSVSSNAMQFKWDIQDVGRYRLDISTNAEADPAGPAWNTVYVYTNATIIGAGQFLEYSLTVTNPVPPIPRNGLFRLRVDRSTPAR